MVRNSVGERKEWLSLWNISHPLKALRCSIGYFSNACVSTEPYDHVGSFQRVVHVSLSRKQEVDDVAGVDAMC